MKRSLFLLAALSVLALPAMAQYNYEAIAKAKEKPPVKQTLNGVMGESHKMLNALTSTTNQSYDAYEAAQQANRARNPPPSASSYCSSSDTCFQIISSNKDETSIKCIKGPQHNIGRDYKICGPNSKGKYAAGCGMTDAFAYHYTFKEAGNYNCK